MPLFNPQTTAATFTASSTTASPSLTSNDGAKIVTKSSGGGGDTLSLSDSVTSNAKYLRLDGSTPANLQILNGGFSNIILQINDVASQANGVLVQGTAAGIAPSIQSIGSDTNIDLTLTPKGTGLVNTGYGTTAISGTVGAATLANTTGGATGPAAATQNSWLAIKINGTTSFLPVWR